LIEKHSRSEDWYYLVLIPILPIVVQNATEEENDDEKRCS